jgi:hypothetical protein
MNSIKLSRLNESHEFDLPKELLSMTVEEMLDRLESIDTMNDAEYEMIEAAIGSLANDIMSTGYEREEGLPLDSTVEVGDEVDFDSEFENEEEDEDIPTFADIESNMVNSKPEDSIEDFKF